MRPASLVFIFIAVVLLFQPAFAQTTYRVGTEGGYPPFNYVKNGEPAGFDVELAKELCKAMQGECKIILVPWDDIITGLINKRYDFVVASMARTEERDKLIDFTTPYYRSRTNFIGNPAHLSSSSPEQLEGKILTTQNKTVQADYLIKHYGSVAKIVLFDTLAESFHALIHGKADAVLTDSLVGYEFLQTEPGQPFDYIGQPLNTNDPSSEACIAVREGDHELKNKLERALQTLRLNGIYERINRRYFPFSVY
jgi:polar amino acid transport system substrate-binding protein